MARRRDPFLSKTERLLNGLLDEALRQPSDHRAEDGKEVASDDRMTVSERRLLLETAMRFAAMKHKIAPPEEEASEFEGMLDELHGGAARTRRRQRLDGGGVTPPANGATPPDAAVVGGEH